MIPFVNGLNDCYETVRNQELLNDPLPTMSKAYSLVLQIEQQNEAYHVKTELNAFNLANKADPSNRVFDKNKKLMDKKNLTCDFCKKQGHARDTYFKLHGVPDWFREMTNRKPLLSAAVS